jgi:predicted nucleic acid-binding protein
LTAKLIVLDANILVRAVLGRRVRHLLFEHAGAVGFFAPDAAYADARKYLPALLKKRGVDAAQALKVLDLLETLVHPVELDLYDGVRANALRRIAARDADDWPVLACAMALDCPVWTEDKDFFGAGVATWTTDRVALYFES